MGNAKKILASDIFCSAVYPDLTDLESYGDQLVAIWIKLRKDLVAGEFGTGEFRELLIDSLVELLDFDSAFVYGCQSAGIHSRLGSKLHKEFVEHYRNEVFDAVPSHLHAEFCWVPDWDGKCLDNMMDLYGLRSSRGSSSNYLEDVQPGKWLENLVRLANCGSEALLSYAKEKHNEGPAFVAKCEAANFMVKKDEARPVLMTPDNVIATIENSYYLAVPMVHCFINVKALLQMDPTKDMALSSDKRGEVHVGLHEGVCSGAGYMDTYPGEVVIPASETGFISKERIHWGVDRVYGLVKSAFNTTPLEA